MYALCTCETAMVQITHNSNGTYMSYTYMWHVCDTHIANTKTSTVSNQARTPV